MRPFPGKQGFFQLAPGMARCSARTTFFPLAPFLGGYAPAAPYGLFSFHFYRAILPRIARKAYISRYFLHGTIQNPIVPSCHEGGGASPPEQKAGWRTLPLPVTLSGIPLYHLGWSDPIPGFDDRHVLAS